MAEYQGAFNWRAAWENGVHFGWYKVSGGGKDPLHVDLKGERNRVESRKARVHSSGYHFWLGGKGVSAAQQLHHFFNLLGPLESGDILPMLDFEDPPDYSRPGQSLPIVLSQLDCRTMVQGCADLFGRYPVIYAGEGIYRRFSWFGEEIKNCPRNIPNYSAVPSRRHDVHQYTFTKRIPGFGGPLDGDRVYDLHRILVP